MAHFEVRIASASKEDLQEIVRSLALADATTRGRIIDFLDYQKQRGEVEGKAGVKNEEVDAKGVEKGENKHGTDGLRRSSRLSSRASSSEASQDSAIQIHPALQEALDNAATKQALKFCKNCSKLYDENSEKCRYHPDAGKWLIEVEGHETILFVRECDAADDVKADPDLPWYIQCCSMQKPNIGEGCATKEHVPMGAEDTDN
ncbi:hypothetical protein CMUS01_08174 [Colletotrichum musicola]|uniref:Uncharacterized protein n=1 Tax=Colletotrichum musicola TaxID=2175873 RepID=A0A8H6NE84_9PEZI|nr:hypothetical protein CMUS01_08174 [Colletotrichum musicola]